jgi:hypothetical protein
MTVEQFDVRTVVTFLIIPTTATFKLHVFKAFNDYLHGNLRSDDDALYADITVYSQRNGTIQNPRILYMGFAINTTVAVKLVPVVVFLKAN